MERVQMKARKYQTSASIQLVVPVLLLGCLSLSGDAFAKSASSVASERFALSLSTSLGLAQPNTNVLVAPTLLQAAFTLLYVGSAAESPAAHELRVALDVQSLGTPEQSVRQFQELLYRLRQSTPGTCSLRLFSEFYAHQRYTFNYRDEFVALASEQGVGTHRLDFGRPASVAEHINYDFLSKSNYSLGEVVSGPQLQFADETPFIHVSAVTYRAPWAKGFDVAETQRLNFFANGHSSRLVDAMFIIHRFRYAEMKQLDARLVELPFQHAGLSLVIIFPNEADGLVELEQKLQHYDLEHLRHQLVETKLALTLPKFKVLSHSDLKQPLIQLGMGKLFSAEAHLCNTFSALLTASPPHLTAATHTVLLEIQETGGDASDSFSFGDLFRRALPMVINHPFYFVISNENLVLLAGHIVDI